jgi:hypothetical protein
MDIIKEVDSLRDLRSTLKAAMLSRPRRTTMQDRWIRTDRIASLAITEAEFDTPSAWIVRAAKARRKMLSLVEALHRDPFIAGARKTRQWNNGPGSARPQKG